MQKGKQSLCFTEAPFIISTANIVGKKEGEGPLAGHFDVIGEDDNDPVFCVTDLLIHLSREQQTQRARGRKKLSLWRSAEPG